MSENEFQERAEREQGMSQALQITAILETLRGLDEKISNTVKKEVRVIREELRMLDKLRPLRSNKEEAEETSVQE